MPNIKIYYGKSAKHWNDGIDKLVISSFSNGETRIELKEAVRGDRTIIIQTFTNNVNAEIMETMLIMDTLRRAGATEITLVLPMFPYARQDRKHMRGVPISAKVICDMFSSYADQIITFDLHSNQIQGFTNTNIIENLSFFPFISSVMLQQDINLEDTTIISPDVGSTNRAIELSRMLKIKDIAVFYKRRENGNIKDIKLLGNIDTSTCLIIDDMVDTGGTLIKCGEILQDYCKDIYVMTSHLILSGDIRKLSIFKKVIGMDSVPIAKMKLFDSNIFRIGFAEYFNNYLYPILERKSQFFPLYNPNYFLK